ncbi:hypothetical protein OUZ56_000332 [Daphnia magna]|uniref:Uncharacterized protein n=1 Tax=Daphnia magna TaxID=35525 RepID=A0ABQ9ZZD4_9CRUS|nr:hypothetical protein OUZ56_000332 [Daphnia magna]
MRSGEKNESLALNEVIRRKLREYMGQVSRLKKNLEVRVDLPEHGGGPFQSGKESESCNILVSIIPLS